MDTTELANQWRERADRLRELGAEAQAKTMEWCADRLEEQLRAWRNERLTLEQGAAESGYSQAHLARLVRDGTLPNAGEMNAPRIRRDDLPRKPGHAVPGGQAAEGPVASRAQMARSVVNSD